ncbi:hypothetical protein L1987_76805 [Smallanthus sonchifolius]|uniref:Uncharacterized protein n=1 Tax=Smallanthus sonchifolius TaxID=185202 RepID=A0ACB8Z915_9ASTR|nr:hypothetical protein L1987_76805 [Smallanthus sonchifolius]
MKGFISALPPPPRLKKGEEKEEADIEPGVRNLELKELPDIPVSKDLHVKVPTLSGSNIRRVFPPNLCQGMRSMQVYHLLIAYLISLCIQIEALICAESALTTHICIWKGILHHKF